MVSALLCTLSLLLNSENIEARSGPDDLHVHLNIPTNFVKGSRKKQSTLSEIDYPNPPTEEQLRKRLSEIDYPNPPTEEQLRKRLSEIDYPLDPFEQSEFGLPGQAQVGNGGVQQQVGQGAGNVQQQVGGGNQFQGQAGIPKLGLMNFGSASGFGQAQVGSGGVQQQVGANAGNVQQQVGGGNQVQGSLGKPNPPIIGIPIIPGTGLIHPETGQAQVGNGGVQQQVGSKAGNVQQQVGGGNQVQGSLGIPYPPIKGIPRIHGTGLIPSKSGQAQVGNGGVQQQVGSNAGNVQQQVGGGNQKQLGK